MTQLLPITFAGFDDTDFGVFEIDGLEPRMDALIAHTRPKLHMLGEDFAPILSELTKEQMYPHVAKHARRTINPPNDTWVAYANNKRGYKAHPHFQIGLWSTHVFVQFAIIYESPNKSVFAERAIREIASIQQEIPDHYVWSKDHMQPTGHRHDELTTDELVHILERLKSVKAAELTCGIHIQRGDPILQDGKTFAALTLDTFSTLLPLYRMAI